MKKTLFTIFFLMALESVAQARVVSHPAGCPRSAFCGCGVSVKVFGSKIRSLYLSHNWLKFPRTRAAPGMVAYWRHGHVAYIMQVNGNGTALMYDPNSGGHRTRIHNRSLRGAIVVNPHGASVHMSAKRHKRKYSPKRKRRSRYARPTSSNRILSANY